MISKHILGASLVAATLAMAPGARAADTTTTMAPADQTGNAMTSSKAGTPATGSNSFTEAQAKARIADAGYSDVSVLKQDDKGVWRGTASKNGKSGSVALDFQGNVVGQ